jgi:exosortase A-associated hydrolase 2
MSIIEQSGYLELAGRAIYGTHYLPAEAPPRLALLIMEPFGEEKRCAFRMLVRLARRLAAAGVAVMRYDASGTGDSAGSHGEAQWQHWREEAEAQIALAQQLPGKAPLMLLGARAGALLAAETAAASADAIQALILLEPLLSGEELLRDLDRRQKIKDMMSGSAASVSAADAWAAGQAADFGGFLVGATMAEQLRELRLLAGVKALPATCAVQIMRVTGAKSFPAAWQSLVDVVTGRSNGSAELIADKPFWGQLDYYESDVILDAVLAFIEKQLG